MEPAFVDCCLESTATSHLSNHPADRPLFAADWLGGEGGDNEAGHIAIKSATRTAGQAPTSKRPTVLLRAPARSHRNFLGCLMLLEPQTSLPSSFRCEGCIPPRFHVRVLPVCNRIPHPAKISASKKFVRSFCSVLGEGTCTSSRDTNSSFTGHNKS